MNIFYKKSIQEIIKEYSEGTLSLRNVAKHIVDSVKYYENYDVWTSFNPDIFLQEMERLEKNMSYNGMRYLEGIPIAVKDIINTEDYPTQMDFCNLKNFETGNDARVIHDIKYAGGIIAGKTRTAQFDISLSLAAVNPFDRLKSAGLSSGSAVAVALGIVPIACELQTSDSIIQSSSYCGVIGYKPSFGLIPRTGILKTSDYLDSVGFMTSHVDNLRYFLDCIRVKGLDYPISFRALGDKNRQVKGKRPWKLAFVKSYLWRNMDTIVKDSIDNFVNKISNSEDVEVAELDISEIIQNAHEVHNTIYKKSVSHYFSTYNDLRKTIPEKMEDIIAMGDNINAETFYCAVEEQNRMYHRMDDFMNDYDILITASTSNEAQSIGAQEKENLSLVWTMLHLPAVNLPVFKNEATGMPFGIQICARKYNDFLMLDFIHELCEKNIVSKTIQQFQANEYWTDKNYEK